MSGTAVIIAMLKIDPSKANTDKTVVIAINFPNRRMFPDTLFDIHKARVHDSFSPETASNENITARKLKSIIIIKLQLTFSDCSRKGLFFPVDIS